MHLSPSTNGFSFHDEIHGEGGGYQITVTPLLLPRANLSNVTPFSAIATYGFLEPTNMRQTARTATTITWLRPGVTFGLAHS